MRGFSLYRLEFDNLINEKAITKNLQRIKFIIRLQVYLHQIRFKRIFFILKIKTVQPHDVF